MVTWPEGVQEEARLQRPGPRPSCLSFSHNKGTELTQHEQPRSDATVNIQLARVRPHKGTGTLKNNSKQQIRHNQHAATHTLQFFLQTRFNERIKAGARTKQNRQGLKRAGGGSPTEVGGSTELPAPHPTPQPEAWQELLSGGRGLSPIRSCVTPCDTRTATLTGLGANAASCSAEMATSGLKQRDRVHQATRFNGGERFLGLVKTTSRGREQWPQALSVDVLVPCWG